MPRIRVPESETPSEPVRFSAPFNIGPPLAGAKAGSVVEVWGATPNVGRYEIAKVDKDWMIVTEKVIEDHVPQGGVKVALVTEIVA